MNINRISGMNGIGKANKSNRNNSTNSANNRTNVNFGMRASVELEEAIERYATKFTSEELAKLKDLLNVEDGFKLSLERGPSIRLSSTALEKAREEANKFVGYDCCVHQDVGEYNYYQGDIDKVLRPILEPGELKNRETKIMRSFERIIEEGKKSRETISAAQKAVREIFAAQA